MCDAVRQTGCKSAGMGGTGRIGDYREARAFPAFRNVRAWNLPREHGARGWWHELCMRCTAGCSSATKVITMLVTLVAILCNSELCLEKVVTTSEQSGITMTACQVNGQIGIADWLANGPYHDWRLQSYKCVMGKYIPKGEA